ncbi:protein of unknown function [Micropruina glycogenica]|uniref:Uncharacterized protein n=1 Tax=Micropruina glycogenica TaxID=75385 RepID=A0A2N9JCX6_9ACTN|nr:protein of unknown function [Micropruina glycogenica]
MIKTVRNNMNYSIKNCLRPKQLFQQRMPNSSVLSWHCRKGKFSSGRSLD